MVKKAVYFVGILCLSILFAQSANGENVRDYSGILVKQQKYSLEKKTIDFKQETGIQEIIFIGDVRDLKFVSDSINQNERVILFVVDIHHNSISVDVSNVLESKLSDIYATELFKAGSSLLKEGRVYEGIEDGVSLVNQHFYGISLDERIKKNQMIIDSIKSVPGFRSEDNSPDDKMVRKRFRVLLCFVFAIIGLIGTLTTFSLIRKVKLKRKRLQYLFDLSKKMMPVVAYLDLSLWPRWAQKAEEEIIKQYSSKVRTGLGVDLSKVPSSFVGILLYPNSSIVDLEKRMDGYRSYYLETKKISNDVQLFASRAGNALMVAQDEIERTDETLRAIKEEGLGTHGLSTRLNKLRESFKKLNITDADSRRECFVGAYRIHLALIQMKAEIEIERESKEFYSKELQLLEGFQLSTKALFVEYKEDYKKWINTYSSYTLKSIQTVDDISGSIDDAQKEIIKAEKVLTSNRDDKYTFAVECLKQAQGFLIGAQMRIKGGRQSEAKIVAIKDGYTKRYAEVSALVIKANEMVLDSDFPMSKGYFVGFEESIANLNRSMERIISESKDSNAKIDWILVDVILTSVERDVTSLLEEGKNGALMFYRRHGIESLPDEIQNHNPFNGFGS